MGASQDLVPSFAARSTMPQGHATMLVIASLMLSASLQGCLFGDSFTEEYKATLESSIKSQKENIQSLEGSIASMKASIQSIVDMGGDVTELQTNLQASEESLQAMKAYTACLEEDLEKKIVSLECYDTYGSKM